MNTVLDCVWQAVRVAGEAVCLCDATNRFVQVNETFRRVYGWEPAELVGESPLKLVPADCDLGLVREVNRTTRTAGDWTGTLPNVRRDGTLLPIRLRTAAVRHGGQTVGFVGFAQPEPQASTAQLSPVQRRIFALLGEGLAPKEIAAALPAADSTVREHLRRMMAKLAAPNLAALTHCAVRHGCHAADNLTPVSPRP